MSTEVYVYADWEDYTDPILVGVLRSSVTKKKEHFSFSYDKAWLQSENAQKIDHNNLEICALDNTHDRPAFQCGNDQLDNYLKKPNENYPDILFLELSEVYNR